MVYRWLSELVVVVHFLFVLFVALGALLVLKWPWIARLHVPVVAWAAAIVSIGFTCPLTPLEKYLRERGGGDSYEGGFIDHYISDVIYPGEYTNYVRAAVALTIVGGYSLLIRRRRRHRRPEDLIRRTTRRRSRASPAARLPRSGWRRAARALRSSSR